LENIEKYFLDPGSRFYRFDRSFQSKLPRHHFEKRISAELFHGANSDDHRLTDPGTFVPADFQSFVSKLPISVIKKVQSSRQTGREEISIGCPHFDDIIQRAARRT